MDSAAARFDYEIAIRGTECDSGKRLFPHILLSIAQEAGEGHSKLFGLGIDELAEKGRAWIISAVSLHFYREMPLMGESVWTTTRIRQIKGLRFMREHLFYIAGEGDPFAASCGEWFLMDSAERKPLRPSECAAAELLERFTDASKPLIERAKRVDSLLRITESKTDLYYRDFKAGYQFIDTNHHLNNTFYLAFSLDTLVELLRDEGISYEESCRLREIHINYAAEVGPYEALRLFCAPMEETGRYLLEGYNLDREESAFRAEILLKMCHNN